MPRIQLPKTNQKTCALLFCAKNVQVPLNSAKIWQFLQINLLRIFFFLRKSFYLFFSPWLSFWTTILGFVLFFLPRNPFARNCTHFAKNYTHFTKNYKHFAKKTRKSVCAFTDIDSGNHTITIFRKTNTFLSEIHVR